ncbi:putative DNA-binding protein ribbon-helix-helix domain-containing protein, partial [Dysosmobacter welbionis]
MRFSTTTCRCSVSSSASVRVTVSSAVFSWRTTSTRGSMCTGWNGCAIRRRSGWETS